MTRHAIHHRRRLPRKGFTTVELMMVLAIFLILTSLAVPYMRKLMTNQQVRGAASDLIADLVYARGEAISRNQEVTITKGGSTWASGWNITTVISGSSATLRTRSALSNTVSATGSLGSVAFESNGRPLSGTATATFSFNAIAADLDPYISLRCIALDPSGKPKAWITTSTGSCS